MLSLRLPIIKCRDRAAVAFRIVHVLEQIAIGRRLGAEAAAEKSQSDGASLAQSDVGQAAAEAHPRLLRIPLELVLPMRTRRQKGVGFVGRITCAGFLSDRFIHRV